MDTGHIDLRASSKQARDVITLLIRCFNAQAHFVNSKIMQSVLMGGGLDSGQTSNLNPRATDAAKSSVASVIIDDEEDEEEMKGVDESALDTSVAIGAKSRPKEFSVAEVLAELDRTKRELQAQI